MVDSKVSQASSEFEELSHSENGSEKNNTEKVIIPVAPTVALSVLDMPAPRTKYAPKKFKGHYSEIESFLTSYERLCTKFNVTSGKERCQTIRQYCSRDVVWVIEGLSGFHSHDWDRLKSELENLYDAARNNRRYTSEDLKKYARQQVKKRISTLSGFKEYCRKFTTIGGWLLSKEKISKEKHAKYFMSGIHKGLAKKLKGRLGIVYPQQPVGEPWGFTQIVTEAEYLLERQREEKAEGGISASEDDDSSSELDDSTEESSSESSSDEEEITRKTSVVGSRTSTRKQRVKRLLGPRSLHPLAKRCASISASWKRKA